ncbi:Pas69 [Actinoplanes phage phiAsp2]|uniref:Pas69 n=1 Tax=Actinoplanes phage phiAsp2 TaxID=279303 RepID=Q6J7W2_9CAUD|nr:Pas69 [Actinoplanes phage phiAsp2]AAT36817.1 Pas69 [Actinoplanes phage phiAsp2]
MGAKDSEGPGRGDKGSGGSDSGRSGAGTGPGRTEGGGRDGNQSGRGYRLGRQEVIWGSGPGRGVPWWRWHGNRVLTLGHVPGLLGPEPVPRGEAREGRTVARIGETRQ